MKRFVSLSLLALGLFAGCAQDNASHLVVHVVTDLVPGPEFASVETSLLTTVDHRQQLTLFTHEARARFGEDYAAGHRVASFAVAPQAYVVRVRLRRANGSVLVAHETALTFVSDYVLRVHITRDCVNVECPGSNAAVLTTCLHGQCVDPRCEEDRSYCPSFPFCNEVSECGAVAACAEASCQEGICIATPQTGACSDTEWCNPETSCTPFNPTGPTGAVCGTICARDASACQARYWNCDGETPVCTALLALPAGTPCGPMRICNALGACVDTMLDTPALLVEPRSGIVTSESGGSALLNLRLATQPTATVTVTVSSSDLTEGTVDPSTLTFTPEDWNGLHTLAVEGVDDAVTDGNELYLLQFTLASEDMAYDALTVLDVPVVNTDDETPGIAIVPSSGLATSESGGTATFSVTLNTAPSSNVTIAFASDTELEGTVAPSSIEFTPASWGTPQIVTITGVDDDIADGDRAYTIVSAPAASADDDYGSLDPVDVSVTNADDDVAGVTVTPTEGLITDEDGASDTFTVRLDTRPTATVTIPIMSSDSSEGNATPNSLVFTSSDWSTPQTVTVTGLADAASDGNQLYTVQLDSCVSADTDYGAIDPADVLVTNREACASGTLLCGGTCAACPSGVGISATGCSGSACVPTACSPWYRLDDEECVGSQDAYVKASNALAGDGFGRVAISADGDTIAVGAVGESGSSSGIDGDQNARISLQPFGAVYVFRRSAGVWSQEAYIKASNRAYLFNFGQVVALSGDGNALVVGGAYENSSSTGVNGNQTAGGATQAGAAYVFRRTGSTWVQEAYIKQSNTNAYDWFGTQVAISADGNALAVTARWEASNAVGINGNQADNSGYWNGAVYVFRRVASVWAQEAYIKGSNTEALDQFGYALALSGDGLTLAAGTPYESSNATGIDGVQSDNSASNSGAVYVFSYDGAVWTQQAYVKSSNSDASDAFGISVSLSHDGNVLAAGAPGEASNATGVGGDPLDDSITGAGAAYVFTRSAGVWMQSAYVKSAHANAVSFGGAVALSSMGTTLAIGASNDHSVSPGGATYVFQYASGTWSQDSYFTGSNTESGDTFPGTMSISGDGNTFVVGVQTEDSSAMGIGGDESDNSAASAGAVYIFTR